MVCGLLKQHTRNLGFGLYQHILLPPIMTAQTSKVTDFTLKPVLQTPLQKSWAKYNWDNGAQDNNSDEAGILLEVA